MDAQIIISREDNTDFLSIGFIQTDTSLVSALGGALANFAEEIGLAGDRASGEKSETKKDAINFSRFQNGILVSKIVPVKEHNPIILIAIKGFDGEDRELDFVVDYASELAKQIVTKFEAEYSSIGIVPRIDDSFDIVSNVAHQMYRKSSDKVRFFTKSLKSKITSLLDDLWVNQIEFEPWTRDQAPKKISTMSQSEVQKELAKYFYIQGMKMDSFFPLVFSSSSNPLGELTKLIEHFLNKKVTIARKEIVNEITKIYTQLKDSSRALSKRGTIEIPEVELINESFIFEKVLVTKINNLEKASAELISSTNKELYKKLFRKYPLKFVAMSKDVVFDKSELDGIVTKVLDNIIKTEISDRTWVTEKIASILRQVISKYTPNDVMRKKTQILEKVNSEFIGSLKKEHPFILLADPKLSQLASYVKTEAANSLERFKTTLDEAVILYNVIGEIHSSLSNERSPSTQDLMILYFLQSVIQPYQFREVPGIVYSLITECLEKTAYGKRDKPATIIQNNISKFERKLDFQLIPETKSLVLRRISRAKPTQQRFETFENLSYFFKSFRASLELTIARILQTIFGPEKLPNIPSVITNIRNELASDLQSVYVITQLIGRITKRPHARELYSDDNSKFLEKNTKFKHISPSPLELARIGYNTGWIKPTEKKKEPKIPDIQLNALKVKIPSLKLEGKLSTLLEKPIVLEKLWVNYSLLALDKRQKELKVLISKYEKQAKVSAGQISGKKKYGLIIKRLKESNRWLSNIISGGGFMRKLFSGGKELTQIFQDISKNIYPTFKEHPETFQNEITLKNRSLNASIPIDGDFQELMMIYASLWVADSKYIENIADELFWDGILKSNVTNQYSSLLDKKINQNLKISYKKDSIKDQKAVIRNAIVEEVVPAFNKIVRTTMASSFNVLKDDRIVSFDERTNDWYISLGTVNIPIKSMKHIFSTIENVSFVKSRNNLTEARLLLNKYYSLKRSKESQTLEEFIRKAAYNHLNKSEVKALEFFSELNEKYIGKSAADTFYSNIRSLAQIFITPVE